MIIVSEQLYESFETESSVLFMTSYFLNICK